MRSPNLVIAASERDRESLQKDYNVGNTNACRFMTANSFWFDSVRKESVEDGMLVTRLLSSAANPI